MQNPFTRNRTEEIGDDVWSYFVIPPFFNHLDLQNAKKPQVIIGGRGCGKTMLLRYLSYHSTFSPDCPSLEPDVLKHIGLYWRADTQFVQLMTERKISHESWIAAFNHLIALVLSIEVIQAIKKIAYRQVLPVLPEELARLDVEELGHYHPDLAGTLDSTLLTLQKWLRQFSLWVNNVGKLEDPVFFPGMRFVVDLVEMCRSRIPGCATASFRVYIDEYENLLPYQQRIINTNLKHSVTPLIFNLAMKPNGFVTRQTLSEESISDIADFRQHDIEDYIDGEFSLFAAEVLLLDLQLGGHKVPIDVDVLRDPKRAKERSEPSYRKLLLDFVRKMFPGLSQLELASGVLRDASLNRRLAAQIEVGLRRKNSNIQADGFIRSALPEASIVTPALLHRRHSPDEILGELDLAESNQRNRFYNGDRGWVHNYTFGCILSIYDSYSRACPAYAGYDTFCMMSRGNMRHLLELCSRSLERRNESNSLTQDGIPPVEQAQAARHTSMAFLSEVRSFGRLGNQLHTFVLRVGSLFALAGRRPSQSESEQSHFSIRGGVAELGGEAEEFLKEAIKWSVLFGVEETKQKNAELAVASYEYVLNPIYSPYFNISYRKKRRLELTPNEFLILYGGAYEQVSLLLRDYASRWSVDLDDANPTLFSHLSSGW